MRIQIDGTGTHNKGAELMLYAVLQEIERKYPDAEVLYNRIGEDSSYIQTNLKFHTRPFSKKIIPILNQLRVLGVLRILRIHYSFLTAKFPMQGIDVVLDAGGFQFGDQWNRNNDRVDLVRNYYRKLKRNGAKIIFLPQAFGPFQTENAQKIAKIISQYADIIFAREKVSYDYLIGAGVDASKVKLYPDFTAIVDGVVPKQYKSLKDGVCIIPNEKMLSKGNLSQKQYISVLCEIVKTIQQQGKVPFLLNHEGHLDASLCQVISRELNNTITVVDNLTALEVKGVISQSYMVISSRFHGVASALSSGVPCLATSWSHKYAELFKDYDQTECVLDFNDVDKTIEQINHCILNHSIISEQLRLEKEAIVKKNMEMWEICWSI